MQDYKTSKSYINENFYQELNVFVTEGKNN